MDGLVGCVKTHLPREAFFAANLYHRNHGKVDPQILVNRSNTKPVPDDAQTADGWHAPPKKEHRALAGKACAV